MAPIIYSASERPPFLPQQNVFQYLLGGPALSPLPAFDDSLPAFIDGPTGFTLTRADLRDRALRVVGALHARGLRKGDTVCIFAFNSLEYVIVAYACLAAGVILSPANGAYTSDELAHQLNDSGSALIFVAPSHVATLEDAKPRLKRAFGVDNVVLLCKPEEAKAGATPYSCVHDLMVSNPAGPERLDGADAQSTAFLCYSSGTTGLPKGVMTTHFNLTSQIQGGNVMFTRMHAGKDVVIDFLPLSHIYAIVVALLQPISQGAAVVILPRFDEPSVLAAIERFKVSIMLCVPPNFITLVNSKLVPKHNLSSLRSVMVGAAPVSAELSLAFMRAIPSARVTGGYGMTETSPNICLMHRGQSSPERAKYVGRLLPIYQARLVREDGEDADGDAGEEGELWVRGPSVMKGYHNNPSATAATIAEGGWMKTGDVATRTPDGWYAIVDRKKELIKYKGFQVAPAELEGLLLEHERVLDAGVVSVYDAEQATELPRAYVVLNLEGKSPATIAQDVMAHVAKRASNHKRLRGGVVVVDAVPKSPSGKILRKLLRERAAKNSDDVHMPSSARL